jgi:hypothetical protein
VQISGRALVRLAHIPSFDGSDDAPDTSDDERRMLGRVDLPTGRADLVDAGHVLPFLARAGDVARVELTPDLAFGLFAGTSYHTTGRVLEPGGRLVIVTDGMLEHGAARFDLPAGIKRT